MIILIELFKNLPKVHIIQSLVKLWEIGTPFSFGVEYCMYNSTLGYFSVTQPKQLKEEGTHFTAGTVTKSSFMTTLKVYIWGLSWMPSLSPLSLWAVPERAWTPMSIMHGLSAPSTTVPEAHANSPSFSKWLPVSLFHYHVTSLQTFMFPEDATCGVKVKAKLIISLANLVDPMSWNKRTALWMPAGQGGHRQ